MLYRIDSGSPNGQVEAIAPALCYTNQGGLWTKINSSHDDVGWLCLIEQSPFFVDVILLFSTDIAGNGPPSHIPLVTIQNYTDKTNRLVYQWYDQAWH